jgi:putative transposase
MTFDNPNALQRQLKKLKRLQRSHSRKQKGSKNKEKSRFKLAKLHARIVHIRTDTLHKFTSHVCKNHAHIGIEDLQVAGMLKNHYLAQAISDASFGEIKQQLTYKAAWYGTRLVVIDRFYPSSKTCSWCGYVLLELALSVRVWVCPNCHTRHYRDDNAAKSMLAVSLTDSLNACGVASSGFVAIQSETSRVEARTELPL